jgi:hypothetical protein
MALITHDEAIFTAVVAIIIIIIIEGKYNYIIATT